MRYAELAGKELIDVCEGVRLGVASSTDLVIDTDHGTLEAMVIYQRTGFFSSREVTLAWAGIKKIGRDLIIVDMSEAVEPPSIPGARRGREQHESALFQTSLPLIDDQIGSSERATPNNRVSMRQRDRRAARHRVAGVDDKEADAQLSPDSETLEPALENEAPQMLLGRLARKDRHGVVPAWRRNLR